MKPPTTSIRNRFNLRFQQLATLHQLKITNDWPLPIPPDDLLLTTWKTERLKKVMRLQEAEADETLSFGYAIGKSGLNFEYDDLLVNAIDSADKVKEIFEIYCFWFIDNKAPAEMEQVLTNYYNQLNHDLQVA